MNIHRLRNIEKYYEVKYRSYKSDEIVVGQSVSFLNLKVIISAELDIDVPRKTLKFITSLKLTRLRLKLRTTWVLNYI